jgi:3,4-dihydroxy 2-butanone 4-phosphate synthase/GTP cyclohydrolase II
MPRPNAARISDHLSSTEEIVQEVRNGRMVILVDDEDRENEGDLIVPAQLATPDTINFMARFGRGLICLCLTEERTRQLGLEPMVRDNGTRHKTAFTASIDALDGIETGVSAADRARTIAVAINSQYGPETIVSPGHVFPLIARDGGVLVRTGHTEAAVDLARLAGLHPSAVICEVMNDDGTMARLDDLVAFAERHELKLGTIRDLILYRRRHHRVVERAAQSSFATARHGAWQAISFRNQIDGSESVALVKGRIDPATPTLVRMHVPDVLADVCGATGRRQGLIAAAMQAIAEAGDGVIVLVPATYEFAITAPATAGGAGPHAETLRDYGIGAQILADLGVRKMVLLTNSHPDPVALSGYGLKVVGERPLEFGGDGGDEKLRA